jgi:AraC-like DNA-binding protein
MKAKFERINLSSNSSIRVSRFDSETKCGHLYWHLHSAFEIVYVRNGWGQIKIDHSESIYEEGALICIAPNIPHMGFGNEMFENHSEVVIQFSEEFINQKVRIFPEFAPVIKLLKQSKRGLVFHPAVKESLADVFEQLPDSLPAKKLLLVLEILDVLSKSEAYHTCLSYDISNSPRDSERIGQVLEYINTHYDTEISTRFIAEQIGLTPNSFCRMFKKITKKTFLEFVNEFRIQKASAMLERSDKNISEVMYLNGFNDLSYFAKQFKKFNEITPSAYQKNFL